MKRIYTILVILILVFSSVPLPSPAQDVCGCSSAARDCLDFAEFQVHLCYNNCGYQGGSQWTTDISYESCLDFCLLMKEFDWELCLFSLDICLDYCD